MCKGFQSLLDIYASQLGKEHEKKPNSKSLYEGTMFDNLLTKIRKSIKLRFSLNVINCITTRHVAYFNKNFHTIIQYKHQEK